MKWKAFIIIIAVSVYVACNYDNEDNLIHTANRWVAATDNIGSSYSYDGELIQDGVISVDFQIAEQTNGHPWVALICDTGYSLENLSGLTIRYRSDQDLIIHLHQTDFGYTGNQTYSHYQFRLPATSIWRSRTVEFDEFSQPEWAPEESSAIPLKLENVNSIHFSPDLITENGGTANIQIRNFNLF